MILKPRVFFTVIIAVILFDQIGASGGGGQLAGSPSPVGSTLVKTLSHASHSESGSTNGVTTSQLLADLSTKAKEFTRKVTGHEKEEKTKSEISKEVMEIIKKLAHQCTTEGTDCNEIIERKKIEVKKGLKEVGTFLREHKKEIFAVLKEIPKALKPFKEIFSSDGSGGFDGFDGFGDSGGDFGDSE